MLVIGIKKKDEILLSQTSVALPGFVDATQLVFMVAVPQIKEVVPQVEPVVLIKSRLRVRTEVISMIEDTTHFPDDLIWDDKIEDETIVNLVRGLSAAVLARPLQMCHLYMHKAGSDCVQADLRPKGEFWPITTTPTRATLGSPS
ncbi:BnaCnng17270D [Brassica napus]|uniref:BnaCnng17270D protein n=2 Tax=Brassica TaxID=3705 RepID=A0A078IHH4_BRANA|nr:BnaCnng17270D [Brassica napus]